MAESPARRERRILEILYERGEGSAAEVQEVLDDGSSYSAVRGMLRVMEEKGLVEHRSEGAKFIYKPLRSKQSAAREALQGLMKTFFEGKVEDVVTTLLTDSERSMSKEELQRLAELIERAKEVKS